MTYMVKIQKNKSLHGLSHFVDSVITALGSGVTTLIYSGLKLRLLFN